jgi:hypothetical protein
MACITCHPFFASVAKELAARKEPLLGLWPTSAHLLVFLWMLLTIPPEMRLFEALGALSGQKVEIGHIWLEDSNGLACGCFFVYRARAPPQYSPPPLDPATWQRFALGRGGGGGRRVRAPQQLSASLAHGQEYHNSRTQVRLKQHRRA